MAELWRQFIQQGIAVIPIRFRSKLPAVARWRDFQSRLPYQHELDSWFSTPRHNVGAVCGHGLVVLDFDLQATYSEWMARVVGIPYIGGEIARTFTTGTPRGTHVYVRVTHPSASAKLPGIDVQSDGKYVLIPPSVHPSGAVYTGSRPDLWIAQIDRLQDLLPDLPEVAPATVDVLPLTRTYSASQNWPATTIDLIRERFPILNQFRDARPSGAGYYMARCPLHDDKHQSMWIQPALGLCKCYAGCTAKANDIVGITALIEGATYKDVFKRLAREVRP